MTMYPFCLSGKHCHNCRNHEATRQGFAKTAGLPDDFACPRDLAIGAQIAAPVPPVNVKQAETPCRYRGKLLQRSSCSCGDSAVWECNHKLMLQPDGSPGRQIGKACGQGKCKGYEKADATETNI